MAGRSLSKLDAAKAEIEASLSSLPEDQKGELSTLELDVTDDASITAAVQTVEQRFGRLDVLVNNAGVSGLNLPPPSSPSPDDSTSDIRRQYQLLLDTNLTGPAVISASFRPLLLKSSNPYSIYVTSGARTLLRNATTKTADHAKIKNGGAYQVSKAGVNMLAVLEARDYGPALKVFAMSPGFVRSNLRGTTEEERSGWGRAGDAEESGRLLLAILRGERDGEQASRGLVHKDGLWEW
jgi:NAD(P)-dependent dehydrogenase (short-subunit alcohol dehydrogenase family)